MRLIILLMSLMALPAFANINCNQLSGDATVLCKQNKRILKKLNALSRGGGSQLNVCEVKYCTDHSKSLVSAKAYSSLCSPERPHHGHPQLVEIFEARNRAHAKEIFMEYVVDKRMIPSRDSRADSIISIECD